MDDKPDSLPSRSMDEIRAEFAKTATVSKELLPCPFCATDMQDHGHCFSHPRPKKGDCVLRYYSFEKRKLWNTRAQPAPADVVEAVARALARSDGIPDDAPTGDYLRNAKAALAAIPVSGEEERLREALEKIADRAAKLRKGTDDWFELAEFENIAREALAPPRSIRVSDRSYRRRG